MLIGNDMEGQLSAADIFSYNLMAHEYDMVLSKNFFSIPGKGRASAMEQIDGVKINIGGDMVVKNLIISKKDSPPRRGQLYPLRSQVYVGFCRKDCDKPSDIVNKRLTLYCLECLSPVVIWWSKQTQNSMQAEYHYRTHHKEKTIEEWRYEFRQMLKASGLSVGRWLSQRAKDKIAEGSLSPSPTYLSFQYPPQVSDNPLLSIEGSASREECRYLEMNKWIPNNQEKAMRGGNAPTAPSSSSSIPCDDSMSTSLCSLESSRQFELPFETPLNTDWARMGNGIQLGDPTKWSWEFSFEITLGHATNLSRLNAGMTGATESEHLLQIKYFLFGYAILSGPILLRCDDETTTFIGDKVCVPIRANRVMMKRFLNNIVLEFLVNKVEVGENFLITKEVKLGVGSTGIEKLELDKNPQVSLKLCVNPVVGNFQTVSEQVGAEIEVTFALLQGKQKGFRKETG